MTDLTGALAILDRLTDPLPVALAEARRTLEELFSIVARLETATIKNRDGEDEDRLWDVQFVADEASDAFDTLAVEVEKR